MKTLTRFTALFISILFCSVQSQSVLSINYPFGLPIQPVTGSAFNMGGVSTGIQDAHGIMLANPGNLGIINSVAFSTLLSFDYLRIKDKDTYTDHLSVNPRQFSFALPLRSIGTVGFSMVRENDAAIQYLKDTVVSSLDNQLSIPTQITIDRSGGTTAWQAGWGRRFGQYITAGLTYERVYFILDNTKLTDLFLPTADIAQTQDTSFYTNECDSTHYTFRGNGIRFGIQGTFKKLTAGMAIKYVFEDDVFFRRELKTYAMNTLVKTMGSSETFSLQMPPTVQLGVSYSISPKWLVGSDLSVILWNQASSSLFQLPADNTVSFSVGGQFIPAPDLLLPKYWETIRYNAGIRYTQLPDNMSNEFAVTLGCGLPLGAIKNKNGLLNIGLELGNRTHETYKDYNERFFKIALGFSGIGEWQTSSPKTY